MPNPNAEPGDVWMSNDRRRERAERYANRFRVVEVLSEAARVVGVETGRVRTIRLDRLRAKGNGYVCLASVGELALARDAG
jgi:hypothetical protein